MIGWVRDRSPIDTTPGGFLAGNSHPRRYRMEAPPVAVGAGSSDLAYTRHGRDFVLRPPATGVTARIPEAAETGDLLLSVGSSPAVEPAAAIPRSGRAAGACLVIVAGRPARRRHVVGGEIAGSLAADFSPYTIA